MGGYYHTDRGNKLMSVACLSLVLVTIVVPARVWVRLRIVRSFGPDDWAVVIATMFGNSFCILVVVGMFFGFGEHIDKVPPNEYKIGLMISWITQLLYIPGVCIAKISVSLFIRRLSPYKTYTKIAWFIIVFMVTYTIMMFFFILTQCHPFGLTWDKSLQGKCLSPQFMSILAYGHSAANITTDFALLFLVIAMMWNVQMPRRQKMAVYGVFGLGTFASLASVVKFTLSVDFGKKGDYLYDINGLATWSIVEIQAGITASSLPTIKPLFRKYFKRGLKSSDAIASNSSERPYPLQYLSPVSRSFQHDLVTMDSESEQHIVSRAPVGGMDALESGDGQMPRTDSGRKSLEQ
ncbi:uncharacterized protein H6S33_011772 [Morchella sextelata]|uniref:uncharacterized protein n=1 Tax=Morchella sextelata TaxID=1174677 RepID=UPI001D04CBB2|nr:uncharacterized protein H6S33_011772 [Morchella sextelata]KAH0610245.1 hypothetical protein H6S33_011772 [Morchella sextelata]